MAKKKSPKSAPAQPLRLEWIDPATLSDNPANWRRHPQQQLAAIDQVLGDTDIGWAGVLLFNERTGRLIDGHARKEAWIKSHPTHPAPVLVGSWSPESEKKILLTLDPLANLAVADDAALSSLIDAVGELPPGDLADVIADLRPEDPEDPNAISASTTGGAPADQYKIIITCRDEAHQTELLDRFDSEGIECKALVA